MVFLTRSLDVEDLHDRRLIRGLFIGAVDADNLAAWLAKISLLGLLDSECQQVVSTLIGGDLEADEATRAIELANDGKGYRAGKDGYGGSVLGNETSEVTGIGEDDNQVDVEILDSLNSRGCESF